MQGTMHPLHKPSNQGSRTPFCVDPRGVKILTPLVLTELHGCQSPHESSPPDIDVIGIAQLLHNLTRLCTRAICDCCEAD